MIVHCPSCGRAHQASDSLLGQRVRCTECNHVFVIQEDADDAGASSPTPAPTPSSTPETDAPVGEPVSPPPTPTTPTTPAESATPAPREPAASPSPTETPAPAQTPAPATAHSPHVPHVPHVPHSSHPTPWASIARPPAPTPQAPAGAPRFLGRFEPTRALRLGRVLLMAGLVLVVLARGMETITIRGAARLHAKAAYEPVVFDEAWADKIKAATKDLHEPERGKQIKELQDKRNAERAELVEGDWQNLKRADDHAVERGTMRIYWLEWVFLLGALALTFGVVTVASLSSGPERTICFILIAVLAFSVFVGGSAWRTVFLSGAP